MRSKTVHILVVIATLALTTGIVDAQPTDARVGDAITRELLPDGLRGLVGDESISLANSSVFAQARESWSSDDDLVAQIDYQLEFRSKVDFMSSEPQHVAKLLTDRPENMGSLEMRLYMSDAEVTEMHRRDAVGDKMDAIVEEVTGVSGDRLEGVMPNYGPNYAGIWQDQLDGGRLVLAVTDRAQLDESSIMAIAGGERNLRIVEQPFSYNQLENYRDTLMADLQKLGLPPHVAAVWTDKGRSLEIVANSPEAVKGNVGHAVPPESFTIVAGSPFNDAGNPTSTHSLSDAQPGIDIQVYDGSGSGGCTWGFNGHTSNLHYIITAGHCLGDYDNNAGNFVADVDVWQNNHSSRDLTSTPYVYSKNDATWDVARVGSTYADDNCYHGDGSASSAHCEWPMTTRALHNSWELGSDRTCSSLAKTNDYKCGYIVDDNFGPNRIVVDMTVSPGDSGSGAKWSHRIDGIRTDRSDTQAFYQTAYHVQYTMGNGYFYFNCASLQTTRSNPADWGSCPAVNA